jgi:hypothetical protein
MKITHTSPVEITKITNSGLFDDCLFFSDDEYAMGKVAATYTLEIEEDKIIDVRDLHDEELIAHIASALDLDEDDAERLLDGRDTAFDHGKEGDDDWWIQAKQGECAKKMGYEACRAEDEQGVVYIVPMLGRESDLEKVA